MDFFRNSIFEKGVFGMKFVSNPLETALSRKAMNTIKNININENTLSIGKDIFGFIDDKFEILINSSETTYKFQNGLFGISIDKNELSLIDDSNFEYDGFHRIDLLHISKHDNRDMVKYLSNHITIKLNDNKITLEFEGKSITFTLI